MSFDACLPIILKAEGGFTNNPNDPGGPTNLGITIGTLSDWLGRPATIDEVEALTPATAGQIYQADYYNASHASDCPNGVDLIVFDEAVNQGLGTAIRSLQAAAGAVVDGRFGPHTLAAVRNAAADDLINGIAADRERRYRASPKFAYFGKGWLNRLATVKADALAMAAAPAPVAAPGR